MDRTTIAAALAGIFLVSGCPERPGVKKDEKDKASARAKTGKAPAGAAGKSEPESRQK